MKRARPPSPHLQGAFFLPPSALFSSSRLPIPSARNTAETYCARGLSSSSLCISGMLGRFLLVSDSWRPPCGGSRGICCRQSAGEAAVAWRSFLAHLVAGAVVFPVARSRIMTSALENYINRILQPAAAGGGH